MCGEFRTILDSLCIIHAFELQAINRMIFNKLIRISFIIKFRTTSRLPKSSKRQQQHTKP